MAMLQGKPEWNTAIEQWITKNQDAIIKKQKEAFK